MHARKKAAAGIAQSIEMASSLLKGRQGIHLSRAPAEAYRKKLPSVIEAGNITVLAFLP